MFPTSPLLRRVALAALAIIVLVPVSAKPAAAQDFFSFLWGGGSRQTVSFPSSYSPRQLIVSFADRKLYWVYSRGEAISYPIAVPKGDARWSGVARISSKRVNPSWTPTPQMRRENPKLPAFVPGGHPRNPLGVRALYIGGTLYRIHGTDAPWTIGTAVSHGCIRMYNDDVLDLYPRVPVGTKVTVTWKRFT
ncbi:MAG TPA: L,D-transpeptidase [Hyphomicrobiaceae bacterium]|nr:L,D-transpeptidase [Hyphomicrobiaceae bacterium]